MLLFLILLLDDNLADDNLAAFWGVLEIWQALGRNCSFECGGWNIEREKISWEGKLVCSSMNTCYIFYSSCPDTPRSIIFKRQWSLILERHVLFILTLILRTLSDLCHISARIPLYGSTTPPVHL